jgi:hypothetical protein
MRMHRDLERGRTEQHAGEAATTPRTQNEELGMRRLVQQHISRVPVLQDRADMHIVRSVGGLRHGAVEDLLRRPARLADHVRVGPGEHCGAPEVHRMRQPEGASTAPSFVDPPVHGSHALV